VSAQEVRAACPHRTLCSRRSGQVVRGAPKDKDQGGRRPGGVEDIFEGARAAGAEQGTFEDMEDEEGGDRFRAFRGAARTLAGGRASKGFVGSCAAVCSRWRLQVQPAGLSPGQGERCCNGACRRRSGAAAAAAPGTRAAHGEDCVLRKWRVHRWGRVHVPRLHPAWLSGMLGCVWRLA
jgi:hypothetical protein